MTRFTPRAALLAATASLALFAGTALAQQNPPYEEPAGIGNTNPLAGLHAPTPAHHALAQTSARPWEHAVASDPVPAHGAVATIPGTTPLVPRVARLGTSN